MGTQFLELAVPCDDVLEALRWFQGLGFTELSSNDAWHYPYAAVTDGQITLGLHSAAHAGLATVVVLPALAKTALNLADSEYLVQMHIDQEDFNTVDLSDHDEHSLKLVEARTYSPPADTPAARLGSLLEWTLPVRDAVTSAQFWAPWTQRSLAVSESPRLHMRLDLGGLALGLSEVCRGRTPALCYVTDDFASLGLALDHAGEPLAACSTGLPGCNGVIRAPGGLTIAIFEQDFISALERDAR